MRTQRIVSVGVVVAGLLAAPVPAQAGESWVPVEPAFTFGPNREFVDVEGTGDGGAWAVGFQREKYSSIPGATPGSPETVLIDIPPKPLLQRFDGSSWKNFTTPGLTGEGALQDVDAVSPTDVWVSGYHHTDKRRGTTYLAHWNGGKWTKVTTPNAAETVSARSLSVDTGGVWLAEGGKVSRLKDGAWTIHDLGMDVYDLRSYPSGEAWAMGTPLVKHFDGTAWKTVDLPPGHAYKGFRPTGPNTGWITTTNGLALWDGSAWTTVPYPAGYRNSSYPSAEVGGPWLSTYRGLLHWDGSAWQELPSDAMPQVQDAQGRIWGTDSQSGASGAPASHAYLLDDGVWKQEYLYPPLSWSTRLTVLPNGLLYTGENKDKNLKSFVTTFR
ncbi:ligand-binding sensor domain-containing protein [Actinocorallia populi]|uniref:hypothetical protein n=1 Tax=Actinocorallia populi TaxID=2079200 RepID=UPI0013003D0D|nr:hypothetical protein [Actinocorallia populi]